MTDTTGGDTVFISAFSGEGYEHYGKLFIGSFNTCTRGNVEQVIYTNNMPEANRGEFNRRYQGMIPGLNDFIERHKDIEAFRGIGPNEKYNFKFDAVKFCRMVFVMRDAIHQASKDGKQYMIWNDGDTFVRSVIPLNLVDMSLQGADYAYVGRGTKHTETGYLCFDVEKCIPILDAWAGYYSEDTFRHESEWHSAFLFDRARECFPGIKGNNITPGGKGHAMANSWIGEIFSHNKGKRKGKQLSPEAKPLGTFKFPIEAVYK